MSLGSGTVRANRFPTVRHFGLFWIILIIHNHWIIMILFFSGVSGFWFWFSFFPWWAVFTPASVVYWLVSFRQALSLLRFVEFGHVSKHHGGIRVVVLFGSRRRTIVVLLINLPPNLGYLYTYSSNNLTIIIIIQIYSVQVCSSPSTTRVVPTDLTSHAVYNSSPLPRAKDSISIIHVQSVLRSLSYLHT
jgi:hypothetical protein